MERKVKRTEKRGNERTVLANGVAKGIAMIADLLVPKWPHSLERTLTLLHYGLPCLCQNICTIHVVVIVGVLYGLPSSLDDILEGLYEEFLDFDCHYPYGIGKQLLDRVGYRNSSSSGLRESCANRVE